MCLFVNNKALQFGTCGLMVKYAHVPKKQKRGNVYRREEEFGGVIMNSCLPGLWKYSRV